ncbi:TetR family transcriptional regulator [Nocardia sp. NPDC005366]|uniref:TetR family transcriptional regulator n=1 Tax=Nocardia sp. NPDC005366 TaxID=3156878 RepID=UPI0033AFC5E5
MDEYGRNGDDASSRERLIHAADEEMRAQHTAAVTMAAVAARAGVSRATAFRQLGGSREMVVQVGLLRAQRHIERARERMAAQDDVFAKMEDVMAYNARELPEDPVIVAMMAQHSASVRHPDIQAVTTTVSGPVLLEGQQSGLIRTDVSMPELIDFLIEQTYLAAEDPQRSEEAARLRFRRFVAPAIRPQPTPSESATIAAELDQALTAATDAVAAAKRAAGRLRNGAVKAADRSGDRQGCP